MSVIHAPRRPELDVRQAGMLGLALLALAAMLVRLWYLQVVAAEDLAAKASTLRTVAIKRLAPRGLIFDRHGTLIAGVEPKWVVLARPYDVKRNPWVIRKLARLLAAPEDKLWTKVEENVWRPHFPAPVFIGADIEVATKIAESGDYLPGIEVDTQPMRVYRDTEHYSHLLGYVWTPSAEDVERHEAQSIEVADYVGKDGLERMYEALLQGKRGLDRFEVDNKRRPKRAVERRAPQPGSHLILSIDAELQKTAHEALAGRNGAVVAMQPSTGEVLALVSSPTFDTTLFEGGISRTDFARLRDDPDFPLMNRATAARYPPGSTFKIVTTTAALLAGTFSPYRTVYCPGYYRIGTGRTRCLGVHGAISFHEAFARSCNTYFATIGMEAGVGALRRASRAYRLGEKTGIDLPSESPGRIPYQEWLDRFDPPKPWYPGDTVNMTIGQGYVETTPVQMACIGAMIANEGTIYRPHLLHAVSPPGSDKAPEIVASEAIAKLDLPPDAWRRIKAAMRAVVEAGTARSAQIPGLTWGAKTGSSEHRTGAQTHGWFVGIAPLDRPEIVISVVVEARGHGGDVAAPIAKAVVRRYFERAAKSAAAASNAAPAASTSSSATPASGPN